MVEFLWEVRLILISETINRIIPHPNPFVTIFVCSPWYVPPWVTSRHH